MTIHGQFRKLRLLINAHIKTLPIKQWEVGREFNRRMKKRFDQCSIEIPFTSLTVFMKDGEKGRLSPDNAQNKKESMDIDSKVLSKD